MKAAVVLLCISNTILTTESSPSSSPDTSIPPSSDCAAEVKVALEVARAYLAVYHGHGKKNGTVKFYGYDMNKDADVKQLVCSIIHVKSVRDLSRVLNKPYIFVKPEYQAMTGYIVRYGGVRGFTIKLNIGQDITSAAKRFGFPRFPLEHSADLAPFFRSMVIRYGQDFLRIMDRRLNFTVTNPDAVGNAFAEASSLRDVKTRLGLADAPAATLLPAVTQIVGTLQFHWPLLSPVLKLLQMMESRGLLILR